MTSRLEQMARRLCEIEGMDPDRYVIGMGHMMPKGYQGPAWAGRLHTIQELLDILLEPSPDMISAGADEKAALRKWSGDPNIAPSGNIFIAMVKAVKEGK